LGRRGRVGTQRNDHVLDAGIAEILRMGMPLAAIADDGDLLRLDEIQIGIPIVIHAHRMVPCLRSFVRRNRLNGRGCGRSSRRKRPVQRQWRLEPALCRSRDADDLSPAAYVMGRPLLTDYSTMSTLLVMSR